MIKLTFLGTGTSQGVPVIACGCSVCRSEDSRDNRLRTSAMIETGGTRIIIDAGPDFRQQMLRENISAIDGILLTHEHKDHIGGMDDVRAFNYIMRQPVHVYATAQVAEIVRKDYDYAFGENRYPGVPDFDLHIIDGNDDFSISDVKVTPIRGKHYELDVLGYRIGPLAYLTDFNFLPREEILKLTGIKILVINALRHEKHLSHFSLEEALQISRTIDPQRTYLTHISHQMGLYRDTQNNLPHNVFLGYDGLCVKIEG